MKEKDEWRFATMEYGGQCVTMAGMKWMQLLSVLSLDMIQFDQFWVSIPLGVPVSNFGAGEGPTLFDNVTCNQTHSELSQYIDLWTIGLHNCDQDNTAGVICPEVISFTGNTTLHIPVILITTNRVEDTNNNLGDKPLSNIYTVVFDSVGFLTVLILTLATAVFMVTVMLNVYTKKKKK